MRSALSWFGATSAGSGTTLSSASSSASSIAGAGMAAAGSTGSEVASGARLIVFNRMDAVPGQRMSNQFRVAPE